MACFIVPVVEAAVVTAVRMIAEQKEKKIYTVTKVDPEQELAKKETLLYKTRWLTNLLWGGSALLAFEHVWHGEVTPWFPFLTAMKDPDWNMGEGNRDRVYGLRSRALTGAGLKQEQRL